MINIACIFFGIFWDQELDGRRERISRSVVAPAFGTFLLFLQLVYWLLLFERTSFYVTLLVQSFLDIIYFLFILLIILLAFAITVFVINKNSFEHHEFNEQEYEDLNTERFKNQYSFLDAFYVQWLLGLGEFEMLGLIDDSELLE